jgi:GAF domain-containing protein
MDDRPSSHAALLQRAREAAGGSQGPAERLQTICRLLRDGLEGYDWVGFYLVDPAADRSLVLGPYEGEPTEHTRIPFGRGICGQAAERGETVVVDDVSQESNYLACSTAVQSEVVVPVYHGGSLVGELDIDSHRSARFGPEDRAFVEAVAGISAPLVAALAAQESGCRSGTNGLHG